MSIVFESEFIEYTGLNQINFDVDRISFPDIMINKVLKYSSQGIFIEELILNTLPIESSLVVENIKENKTSIKLSLKDGQVQFGEKLKVQVVTL